MMTFTAQPPTPTRSVSEEAAASVAVQAASSRFLVGPTSRITPPPLSAQATPSPEPQQPPRAGRDCRGRFTHGCRPGPGRPPKKKRSSAVSVGEIYLGTMQLEKVIAAWQSVVARNGPAHARQLLRSFEAEHGPIVYREIALAAIKAAERSDMANQPAGASPG